MNRTRASKPIGKRVQLLILGILTATLLVVVAQSAGLLRRGSTTQFQFGSSEVIFEDDPRFNCATMGNKICGPSVNPPAGR